MLTRSVYCRGLNSHLMSRYSQGEVGIGLKWGLSGHWRNFFTKSKTSGRDIGKVELEDVQLTPPSGSDTELAVLMNTWIPPLDYSAPKVKVRPVPPDIKSKVLFVGGSFNWIVLEMLWSAGLPSSLDFLYYYHNKVSYPDPAPQLQQNIDRLDWESDIFNNDVIVLEINEMYVSDDFDSLGSGFARDALVRLKKLKLATKH